VAPQPTSNQAAAAQQQHQAAIALLMAAPMATAFTQLYVPGDPASITRWIAFVTALVRKYGQVSSASSAGYYEAARQRAGITSRYRASTAPTTPSQAVEASMRWAIAPVEKSFTVSPQDVRDELMAAALERSTAAAEKLAIDEGRMTVLENQLDDKQAQGWVRVTRPGACSFCALLAIRGPVYKSEQSASFQAHNHDRCFPAPVFVGETYEVPPQVAEWRATYQRVAAGKSGKAARLAFRQALEGRSTTTA
jgi:hypothetical protein